MAKPGRNEPCPCGSGNKYKKCCQPKDEVAERDVHAAAQARREDAAADRRLQVAELKAAIAAKLAGTGQEDQDQDELDVASNAVRGLIKVGKLDEAEAVSRALLARYPEVHDGWDRLGMVHEARGKNLEAADCYRKIIDFIRQHADDFDAVTVDDYAARIAKLDPPAAG